MLGGFERSIADYRQELARREAALVGFEDTAALRQAELARSDADLAAFQKSVAEHQREVRARDERLDALEDATRARSFRAGPGPRGSGTWRGPSRTANPR